MMAHAYITDKWICLVTGVGRYMANTLQFLLNASSIKFASDCVLCGSLLQGHASRIEFFVR